MSPSQQSLGFFGATGGTANSALAHALKEGYYCTALARTPQKLIDMLTSEHGVSRATIDNLLTIHAGDAKDVSTVSKVLISPVREKTLVDTIIFGIGAYPTLQWSLRYPLTITDPTICQDSVATVFSAISLLANQNITSTSTGTKPVFVSVSTTGISTRHRDVPYAYYPFYHALLHIPHQDKKAAEQLLFNDKGEHIRNYIVIRPTLLSDARVGAGKVRCGWEWGTEEMKKLMEGEKGDREKEPGPVLGWTVGRKDVGEWVFRHVVHEGGWEGRCVSLTY